MKNLFPSLLIGCLMALICSVPSQGLCSSPRSNDGPKIAFFAEHYNTTVTHYVINRVAEVHTVMSQMEAVQVVTWRQGFSANLQMHYGERLSTVRKYLAVSAYNTNPTQPPNTANRRALHIDPGLTASPVSTI